MSNPALEPLPEERKSQAYKVMAPTAVHGHGPGTEFTMLLPPEQEALLIESGALEKVPPKTPAKKEGV